MSRDPKGETGNLKTSTKEGPSLTVLVINSSAFMRNRLRQILKEAHFVVFEVGDASLLFDQGLSRFIRLDSMSLVILDLDLGPIDGLAVLRVLSRQFPALPVVVLSRDNRKGRIIKSVELGVSDYVLKPFDEKGLVERIKAVLNKQEPSPVFENGKLCRFFDEEVERSQRIRGSFVILALTMDERELTNYVALRHDLARFFRRIDHQFLLPGGAVFLFPLTNESGEAVVKDKVLRLLTEKGLGYQAATSFLYPRDFTIAIREKTWWYDRRCSVKQ
ncbi:MAG TPA: response regulator [Atribacteraceae bacterium]|nr:response regulator [Atribacteraceae bacterium]